MINTSETSGACTAEKQKPKRKSSTAYMRVYRQNAAVYAKELERNRIRAASSAEAKAKVAARVSARRAVKAKRTAYDLELTKFVVVEAQRLAKCRAALFGFRWDVDHVVPLKNNIVSGLHVWANVEVVPAAYNRSKGNRFWPDMP